MPRIQSAKHEFGGDWTVEKLERVRKYLIAYTTIFTKNPKARYYRTIYVDAFAGTGYRSTSQHKREQVPLTSDLVEPDREAFMKGSARVALEVEPPFDRYLFIEKNPGYVQELEILKQQFPDKADKIDIIPEDANVYLKKWCAHTNWKQSRAVVFLDPYGMEVEWSLIEALGRTKAVDLWVLFPLGVAVNRFLTKLDPPPQDWANLLTKIFGTEQWRDAFYPPQVRRTLFGNEEIRVKEADFNRIGQYFVMRLKTVFAGVADNPLPLFNSKNVPLYLLCFAAGNPRGAPTALRIAKYILRR